MMKFIGLVLVLVIALWGLIAADIIKAPKMPTRASESIEMKCGNAPDGTEAKCDTGKAMPMTKDGKCGEAPKSAKVAG